MSRPEEEAGAPSLRPSLNLARDDRLRTMWINPDTMPLAPSCRQCGYDRARHGTCGWCGATGRQRRDEVPS